MLSPSDFNNAVPQFTNGDYASNPINPQYIAEPDAENYNRGTEPLQTLPAQWWNWFLNRFTNRFNKVNVYVKNIFNELAQLLSLVSVTPSGTEGTPTVGQMKDMFETKYPDYLKTTPALSNTYVPQTTKVNGQALSGNVTINCIACAGANGSGTAFGTAATCGTVTGGSVTYVDYSGTNGCRLMTSNFLAYWNGAYTSNGASNLRYFCGGAFGSAAACAATAFRASDWTPTVVECANKGKNGSSYSTFGSNAFNSTSFTTCTGTVTSIKFQCASTDKCTITGSGTINLSANAWNANATISTQTYPGACCTGTLTSSSGCAYDSARLGGTAASSYLKTTGCAADSAKLGGYTYSQVIANAGGGYTKGNFGNACWTRSDVTRQYTVFTVGATLNCDLWKAFCCATRGFAGCTDTRDGISGKFYGSQANGEALVFAYKGSSYFYLANYNITNYITVCSTCASTNICGCTRVSGMS